MIMSEEELEDAFIEFAAEYPQKGLALVTGLLVGLVEHQAEKNGADKNKQITIDGGTQRNIVIEAVKDVATQSQDKANEHKD